MSSSYGKEFRITIFGESHSSAIGVTMEGLPAGESLDFEELVGFMQRRAPGQSKMTTSRKEPDLPDFLCGIKDGVFCGTPVTAIIHNTNTRSQDYNAFADIPRPGHADYPAEIKYFGAQDKAGGGHFSGRLTAPLCIAGGICLQLLKKEGISVISRIQSIAGIADNGLLTESTAHKPFPVVDDGQGEKMQQAILAARSDTDSVGGIIECAVLGLPVGLGDPMFDGMENRISSIVFGIPAVKAIEFGDGFAVAAMRGSENNDAYYVENGQVRTRTNHAGGILGGISNGMPLVFRGAVKPTASIAKLQDSFHMQSMEPEKLSVHGRHDPCIVIRAVPCMEAAAAIAVYDALLTRKKQL